MIQEKVTKGITKTARDISYRFYEEGKEILISFRIESGGGLL